MVLLAILCQKTPREIIFKEQVKRLCTFQNDDRKWESRVRKVSGSGSLLVMMGIDNGERVKTKKAQETFEEEKQKREHSANEQITW